MLPPLNAIHMVSAKVGWALTTTSNASGVITGVTLWRTANGARTWVRGFRETGSLLAWAAPAAEDAWVVLQAHSGRHFQVWETEDGGARWQSVTLEGPGSEPIVTVLLTASASGVGSVLATGPVGTQTGPQALRRITVPLLRESRRSRQTLRNSLLHDRHPMRLGGR